VDPTRSQAARSRCASPPGGKVHRPPHRLDVLLPRGGETSLGAPPPENPSMGVPGGEPPCCLRQTPPGEHTKAGGMSRRPGLVLTSSKQMQPAALRRWANPT